jgi:hypothetical protein
MLTLTLPLERFLMPAVPIASPTGTTASGFGADPPRHAPDDSHAAEPAPRDASTVPPDPVPSGSHPADSPEAESRPSASEQPVELAFAVDRKLAREVVGAALRAAGAAAVEARLSSLSKRARTSAALPELRLRGGRSTDESLRLYPTSDDPYRYSQAGGAELFFEVRLTWKLDRLVFSTAELRVEQLRRWRAQARAHLVRRVLELLFAWQRARARQAILTLLPEERAAAVLDELEAEAVLDVLTAGWFSDRVRR